MQRERQRSFLLFKGCFLMIHRMEEMRIRSKKKEKRYRENHRKIQYGRTRSKEKKYKKEFYHRALEEDK